MKASRRTLAFVPRRFRALDVSVGRGNRRDLLADDWTETALLRARSANVPACATARYAGREARASSQTGKGQRRLRPECFELYQKIHSLPSRPRLHPERRNGRRYTLWSSA